MRVLNVAGERLVVRRDQVAHLIGDDFYHQEERVVGADGCCWHNLCQLILFCCERQSQQQDRVRGGDGRKSLAS